MFEKRQSDDGIGPPKKLFFKANNTKFFDNLLSVLGIVPPIELLSKYKDFKFVKSPTDLGTDPERRFLKKDMKTRDFNDPIVDGSCLSN